MSEFQNKMVLDRKPNVDDAHPKPLEASPPEQKLAIQLPVPTQIYTAGSTVAGFVYLNSKEPEKTAEVRVSLVCVVRSHYDRNMGESGYDFRIETTKLVHRDQTLWTCGNGDISIPPATLPFEMVIPDVGNDTRAKDPNSPLPPSFHAGSHRGWKNFMTYGASIGYVRYYVQVAVVKKGMLKHKNKAKCRFMFLPPSSPPPLLPLLPETIPDGQLILPEDQWRVESSTTSLRHAFISTAGHASLSLWLPRVSSFPRRTSIPFFLCLTFDAGDRAPAAQLDKATLFLRQKVHSCARSGRLTHITMFDKAPTDNMLHGLVPQVTSGRIIWRGRWTSRDIPNFNNRQLSWEYALVAEVPIKGLGNCAKLMSSPLEISSGVTVGTIVPSRDEGLLDFPPGYFGADESDDEDDECDIDEKNGKT